MRDCVIQEYDRRYPIRLMCRALAVSSLDVIGTTTLRTSLKERRAALMSCR